MKSKYRLRITGKNLNRFLRMLYKLHIDLLSIEQNHDSCIVEVDFKNYQKLKKIKTSYTIEVIGYKGIAHFRYLIQHYLLFGSILLCGFFVLFILTHLTFEVEVVHTKEEIRHLIEEELKQQGIYKFSWKVSFERQEEIVEKILNKYKDKIEWLEIENVGTKYIVKVEERKLNEEQQEDQPQDIVAKKDGVILKIEAANGTVVKKKNDYVKKGDIIITGVIKNQDTLMTVVPAHGRVFAETWYRSQVEMPLHYKESFLTGKKKTILQISFLNHKFGLFDFQPFEHSKDVSTNIVSNPLIPFSIQKTEQQELKVIDEVYDRDEAVEKAQELASQKLEKRLGVNDEIISQKTLKITEKESKIIVEVFFKVKEDITDTQLIDLEKIKKEEEKTE